MSLEARHHGRNGSPEGEGQGLPSVFRQRIDEGDVDTPRAFAKRNGADIAEETG